MIVQGRGALTAQKLRFFTGPYITFYESGRDSMLVLQQSYISPRRNDIRTYMVFAR